MGHMASGILAFGRAYPLRGGSSGFFGTLPTVLKICQSPFSRRSCPFSHSSMMKRSFFSFRLFGPVAVRLSIYRT